MRNDFLRLSQAWPVAFAQIKIGSTRESLISANGEPSLCLHSEGLDVWRYVSPVLVDQFGRAHGRLIFEFAFHADRMIGRRQWFRVARPRLRRPRSHSSLAIHKLKEAVR